MKTVDFFQARYRNLKGHFQNIVIYQIQQLFVSPLNFKDLEDSLFDSNPTIYFSYELNTIKFSIENFEKVIECYKLYNTIQTL